MESNNFVIPKNNTNNKINLSASTSSSAVVAEDNINANNINNNCSIDNSDDQLWVEQWLLERGKIGVTLPQVQLIPETVTKTKIPISVAKSSLRNCLVVIEKLQNMQEELKENAESMSSNDWKKKTFEIGSLKDQFSQSLSHFDNLQSVNHLKKQLEKRKVKRLNMKKRKILKKEEKQREIEENKTKHKIIDEWLENKKEEVEKLKAEEIMKKDADCILSEVIKKKSDARKQLNLISALVKFRQVQEKIAIEEGQKVSLGDSQAFAKTAERLTKVWEDSLKMYAKEEQDLRSTLEKNAVEDTIATKAANEMKIIQEWENALFGPKEIPTTIYSALTSAEKNLKTFIAIRKSWDFFLSKPNDLEGSKIPIGWILPTQDALDSWKKYLAPLSQIY